MSEVHCFTSASFAYLDRVRVLAETLRRHQPGWRLWLCLVDQEPHGFTFDPKQEGLAGVVRVSELGLPDLRRQLFTHDVVEMCTAVKGAMLERLLQEGREKVVYLDPDIAVLGSLAGVERLLDEHDVLLTPHQVEPDDEPGAIRDNEMGSLKYGIYNLGFLAVSGRPGGRRFARWWRQRLQDHCYDDVPNGIFTDQRWCDLAPALFAGVHVLRDPGYNVASWNLSRRPISIGVDGTIRAAGSELRFFHFTKVGWVGEVMLERYASGGIEVFELLEWYRRRLAAHRVPGLPETWWAFANFADGTPISRAQRRLYRDRPDLQHSFPDPFAAGTDAFPT
ncbi:hypothetical protein GXW78_02730 [Roseomonas terrae]|uniref:Glycosyl transferase n=1 Tax=Neoroseomonas terrae TaxID=424799 RepID=A0ABS5EC17_9PROT|nr:hypothetical protein [Neoroseomonas terrae]MBR0648565.1 hypothetical protein [Neoroseomonas terrae]